MSATRSWAGEVRITVCAAGVCFVLGGLGAAASATSAPPVDEPPGLHVLPIELVFRGSLDSDGSLWVTGGAADATHVTVDGRVVRYRLPYREDIFASTWASGAFWMASDAIDGLIRLTPDGRVRKYPRIWRTISASPWDMIEGPDGTVWLDVGKPRSRQIVSVAVDGTVRTVAALEPGVLAEFLGVGRDGSVWFSDTGNALRDFDGDPHGGVARVLPDGRVEAFRFRKSIIVDGKVAPNGDLWFIRFTRRSQLVRIDPQGRVTRFPSPVVNPTSIAVAADGTMWLAGRTLTRIDPGGHVVRMRHPSLWSEEGTVDPFLLAPDGRLWLTLGSGYRYRLAWLSPNPCLSRRRVTLHLHSRHGDPIRSVRVIVPGQFPRTVRGRNPTVTIDLRGYLPASVRVTLKVHSVHRRFVQHRIFHTCGSHAN